MLARVPHSIIPSPMVTGAIIGLVCIVALVVLTIRICDKLVFGPVINRLSKDLGEALAREDVWREEAQLLTHDADYQHTHKMVTLVEGKLGIKGSKALTVNERAAKVLKIDGRLLRILIQGNFTPKEGRERAASPNRIRDAQRMLDLRKLIHGTTSGNERAAAQKALDRLIEKYE